MTNFHSTLCFLNNRLLPYNEARLHISDVGLQRGFGIFDYFLEWHGKIPFLNDYLDRFYHSANLLGLEVLLDREMLIEKISYLLSHNGYGDSGIKIILTGGNSEDLYSPSTPNLMIINLPLFYQPDEFTGGLKLMLLEYKRFLPEVKTLNYLPSVMLLPVMKSQGTLDVLFHQDGIISETSRANFFLVRNGKIITAHEGILRGVTRKYVIKLAKHLTEVEEREVRLDELKYADEAFITGTSKHVAPVVQVGETIISNEPGALTVNLMQTFKKFYNSLI
jgi:branched-subunit amino acid aminotransferase/4-amino-4-deoxychorismate lyase